MNLESKSLIAKFTDWSDQRVLKVQKLIAYVELAVALVYCTFLVGVPILGYTLTPYELLITAAVPMLMFLVSDRRFQMVKNYKKINQLEETA